MKKKFKELGKLLNVFQNTSACVEMRRATHYDGKPLYRIIEFPKNNKAKWHEEIYYFDYTYEAIAKFKDICDFWLQ